MGGVAREMSAPSARENRAGAGRRVRMPSRSGWWRRRTTAVRAAAADAVEHSGAGNGGEGADDGDFAASVTGHGEAMIQSILEEISKETFFEDMRYGISGSEEDRAAAERARDVALEAAMERRAESDDFDDRFLLALEAFISTLAGQQGMSSQLPISGPQAGDLLSTLRSIRERALDCVRRNLPVEIRCIEYLMVIGDEAVRENTMAFAIGLDSVYDSGKPFYADCPRLADEGRDAASTSEEGEEEGETSSVARRKAMEKSAMDCGQRLLSGLNQMIEDMEKSAVVVDAVMLARLVLLRENVRDHVNDDALMAMADAGVSRQEMAFMKELLSVGDAGRRRALLTDAFGGKGMRLTRGKKKETVARRGPATEEGPRPGGLEKENMDADSIREMFAASLSRKIDNKTNTQQANARTGTSPGTVTSDDPTKTEMKDEEGVGVRPGRFFDASRLLEVELKIERVRFGPMTPGDAAKAAEPQLFANRARQNAALMARITEVIEDARLTLNSLVASMPS